MVDTSVSLCGLRLKNPVIPASGTCGFGAELAELFDINLLGAIALKGTTLSPRAGNAQPRIAETPAGMLNAVGLENPGAEALVREKVPELRKFCDIPVIANISGFSEDEFASCCALAQDCEGIDMVELNISCPNVHGGGMAFGTSAAGAAAAVKAARASLRKPLMVKLSPNVTDITEIARAAEAAGADAISLINTVLAMRIDLRRRAPLLANVTGGLSGPAIFPLAVRMVYDVSRAVKLPVVGMGGVSSAADVIELMLAGATAVQVGAAGLADPFAWKKIITALPAEAERLGISALSEITGAAHGK